MVDPLQDLSRLAIHTRTNKPWSLEQCLRAYERMGIGGISVWRDAIQACGTKAASAMVKASGLQVPAVVRGGFFPAADAAARERALDDNKRAIAEAVAVGADMLVLVVGAVPGMPLEEARLQVMDGIAALLPDVDRRVLKVGS